MSAITTPPPSLLAATDGRRRPLISLTPLIDVVFILLVFFMLASSFLDWRAVTLDPPARTGAGMTLDGAILIDIRADGLRFSGEDVTPDALTERLTRILARKPEQAVIVRPAGDVSLQRTIAILDRLTAAGVTRRSRNRAGGG